MSSELPVGSEALLAERGRLESLLAASEDWRALLQLKSRQERGEGLSAVNAARLEALLIDALSENPFYGRYKAVCAALNGDGPRERSSDAHTVPAEQEPAVDELTRIRGVDAATAKRLRGLGVWSYAQISEWTSLDIHRVTNDLGLGKLIHSQNWIEQAALLALANPRATLAAKVAPAAAVTKPGAAASPVQAQQFVQPVVLPKQEPLPVSAVAARVALTESAPRVVPLPAVKVQAQPPASPAPPPQQQRTVAPAVEVKPPAAVVAAPAPQPVARTPEPAVTVEYAAPGDGAARILPMPPTPLRVASAPVVVAKPEPQVTPKPAIEAVKPQPAQQSAVQDYPHRQPPKPFVVTRASLPVRPAEPIAPANVAPSQVSAAVPAPVVGKAAPVVAPPISKPPAIPAGPVAAAASAASAAPTMTIMEAIAYAAAAARSSQRPHSDTATGQSPADAANGASNGTVQLAKPAAPPPIPAAASTVSPSPTAPPPIPAGAAPAVAKTEAAPPKPRIIVKPETPRAIAIDRDREELGGLNTNMNIEEASVEIVRKATPGAAISPKTALATAVAAAQASAQAAGQTDAPRTATPIGRFLKALSGN